MPEQTTVNIYEQGSRLEDSVSDYRRLMTQIVEGQAKQLLAAQARIAELEARIAAPAEAPPA